MEKKKMNDKGFSLVELIIVIAIMAILIAVLAPQYLKFVERSRKSADKDTVDQIIRAVQIDAADPESTTTSWNGTITLTTTNASVSGASGGNCSTADLATILTNTGIDRIGLKSKQWTNSAGGSGLTTIYINFSMDASGNVKATVTDVLGGATTNIQDGKGTLITE